MLKEIKSLKNSSNASKKDSKMFDDLKIEPAKTVENFKKPLQLGSVSHAASMSNPFSKKSVRDSAKSEHGDIHSLLGKLEPQAPAEDSELDQSRHIEKLDELEQLAMDVLEEI